MQTSQTINSLAFFELKICGWSPWFCHPPTAAFLHHRPCPAHLKPPKTRLSPAATAGHSAYLILSVNSFSHKSTQLAQCSQKCVLLALVLGLAHCGPLYHPSPSRIWDPRTVTSSRPALWVPFLFSHPMMPMSNVQRTLLA